MLLGEQNPAHRLDALHRADVTADGVYLGRASGA